MRIVAGAAKGRRLASPAAVTRPTSDRVREAMFNTLDSRLRLAGARVLDLFAGTGAVGLEALSRGAAEAVLVEKDRRALEVLRKNVAAVGLPGARVVARPVSAFLAGAADEPFDLLFADPPYALEAEKLVEVITAAAEHGWLAPQAYVVVECAARGGVPEGLSSLVTPVTERRYGDTLLWYGRRR